MAADRRQDDTQRSLQQLADVLRRLPEELQLRLRRPATEVPGRGPARHDIVSLIGVLERMTSAWQQAGRMQEPPSQGGTGRPTGGSMTDAFVRPRSYEQWQYELHRGTQTPPDMYGATQNMLGSLGGVVPMFGRLASLMGTVRHIAEAWKRLQEAMGHQAAAGDMNAPTKYSAGLDAQAAGIDMKKVPDEKWMSGLPKKHVPTLEDAEGQLHDRPGRVPPRQDAVYRAEDVRPVRIDPDTRVYPGQRYDTGPGLPPRPPAGPLPTPRLPLGRVEPVRSEDDARRDQQPIHRDIWDELAAPAGGPRGYLPHRQHGLPQYGFPQLTAADPVREIRRMLGLDALPQAPPGVESALGPPPPAAPPVPYPYFVRPVASAGPTVAVPPAVTAPERPAAHLPAEAPAPPQPRTGWEADMPRPRPAPDHAEEVVRDALRGREWYTEHGLPGPEPESGRARGWPAGEPEPLPPGADRHWPVGLPGRYDRRPVMAETPNLPTPAQPGSGTGLGVEGGRGEQMFVKIDDLTEAIIDLIKAIKDRDEELKAGGGQAATQPGPGGQASAGRQSSGDALAAAVAKGMEVANARSKDHSSAQQIGQVMELMKYAAMLA